jgi:hypothetical protein
MEAMLNRMNETLKNHLLLGTLILIISIPAYFIFKRLLLTTDDDIRRIIEKS